MIRILYLAVFILLTSLSSFAIERDEYIEELLKSSEIETPQTNINYNYESFEKIPIKLNIKKPITTKDNSIYEGQVIDFYVKENVKYENKIIIKKGTPVSAVIQAYISRGMNGIPALIVLDNFKIPNIDSSKLKAEYVKKGHNRTLLVFPIKWALTLIPGAGYIPNLILGGHANIKKKDTIIIYYYPKWNDNTKETLWKN